MKEVFVADQQVSAAEIHNTDASHAPATRLSGRRLLLARVMLFLLAIGTIGIYITSIPGRYDLLRSYALAHIVGLGQLGFSGASFALYFITFDLVSMVVFSLTALIIFLRRSDEWMTMFTSIALVIYGAFSLFFFFSQGRFQSPENFLLTLMQALGLGLTFTYYYVFPSGRFIPRWTLLLTAVYIAWACTWFFYPAADIHTWPLSFSYIVITAFCAAGIFAQFYRYRRVSNATQRQQTKWVVFGLTVIALGWTCFNLFRLFLPAGFTQTLIDVVGIPLVTICQFVVPVSLGIATLRFRLWDVDPLINRVLVYIILTGVLAAIYFGLVILLQFLLRGLIGLTNDISIVASTLAIAALFQPLRHRIQAIIDRRFYRRKYDAVKALATFTLALRHEVDLDQLRVDLLAVIEETMQPSHASLWLRENKPSWERNTRLLPLIEDNQR